MCEEMAQLCLHRPQNGAELALGGSRCPALRGTFQRQRPHPRWAWRAAMKPWPYVTAALALGLALVGYGVWMVQELRQELEISQMRQSALEARLLALERSAAKPEPRSTALWKAAKAPAATVEPAPAPAAPAVRRLSDWEAGDSETNAKWLKYLAPEGRYEADWLLAGAEHDFVRLSDDEKVKHMALHGEAEELFSFLEKMEGKERERSKALALASAAFGDVVFGFSSEMPEEMDVYTRVATLVKKTTNKFDARVDIVRQLFTQGTLPDNDFLNHGFAQAKRKEIDVEEPMLQVLAWGALRRVLLNPVNQSCHLIGSEDPMYEFMAEVYELVESTGLRGLLVAIDNLGGNDHLPPELNFLPWHAVRYAYEHPKVLEETTSSGLTMLMEASSMPHCKQSWNMVTMLHELRGAPWNSMTEWGGTAAMLAAVKGNFDQCNLIEEAHMKKELQEVSEAFHFPYMTLVMLGLHVALGVVSFLFTLCQPEASPTSRCPHLRDFAVKTLILMGANAAVHYATMPADLLMKPLTMVQVMLRVSWNINFLASWPIFACLVCAFLVFMAADLREACRMSRPDCLMTQRRVKATNIYEDPTVPISSCIRTFLLGAIFMCVYVTVLCKAIEMTLFSRSLWAASIFVQAYVTNSFEEERQASDGSLQFFARWALRLDGCANNELWAALLRQSKLTAGQ
ncbi:unnamed protein product, partial [Effrenium voratum]